MRYYVQIRVDYAGWIEADSEQEAEELAYTSYGDTMDSELTYDGVYSITVEEDPEPEDEDEDEEGADAE